VVIGVSFLLVREVQGHIEEAADNLGERFAGAEFPGGEALPGPG
jgi:hypothetical protein